MVWPSALHSIARPLQLSAASGRQIGRGFAPGQQPLPLRKPLPRSSRSSSRQRSLPRCTTATTKHWAPAITSSCLYIDARYLSCSNRGPFATCYLFCFIHHMLSILVLFTTCYVTLTHIYYLFSLHFALFSVCYHLVRLLLPVSKSHHNFIFHAEFLLKESTVSN